MPNRHPGRLFHRFLRGRPGFERIGQAHVVFQRHLFGARARVDAGGLHLRFAGVAFEGVAQHLAALAESLGRANRPIESTPRRLRTSAAGRALQARRVPAASDDFQRNCRSMEPHWRPTPIRSRMAAWHPPSARRHPPRSSSGDRRASVDSVPILLRHRREQMPHRHVGLPRPRRDLPGRVRGPVGHRGDYAGGRVFSASIRSCRRNRLYQCRMLFHDDQETNPRLIRSITYRAELDAGNGSPQALPLV